MGNKNVIFVVIILSIVIFSILAASFIKGQKESALVSDMLDNIPEISSSIANRYNPNRALEAMPKEAIKYYINGKKLYVEKNYRAAASEFNKSIKVFESAQAYCELALCYMEQNNFNVAIEKLNKSVLLDSIYPKAEYALAVSYAQMIPPSAKEARVHYEKAKELGYNIPEWFTGYLAKLEKKQNGG